MNIITNWLRKSAWVPRMVFPKLIIWCQTQIASWPIFNYCFRTTSFIKIMTCMHAKHVGALYFSSLYLESPEGQLASYHNNVDNKISKFLLRFDKQWIITKWFITQTIYDNIVILYELYYIHTYSKFIFNWLINLPKIHVDLSEFIF